MSLEETRLSLAVKLVNHALRNTKGTDAATRTAAFRDAYRAIQGLEASDELWSIETLESAWELVREAYPTGGPVSAIVADLVAAHQAIVETAPGPGGAKRKKSKRDA